MIHFNTPIAEIYIGNRQIKEVYYGSTLRYRLLSNDSYMILTDDSRIDFGLKNTPLSNLSTTGGATSFITINGQSVVKNTIKEIYFGESYNGVTSIGDNFLYNCLSLETVDLSPLSNITSIGDSFLGDCSNLTSVDLSPLSNLTSIGDYFLGDCSVLTSVDLSPLSNVTSIGNYFLRYCSSLETVDLSPLSNVTSIGDYFLRGCSKLTSVDLSPLSKVTSIGTYFLYYMGTLSEVKMGTINPPTLGSYAFSGTTVQSILVPCESVDDYKGATNWSSKASVIGGEDCPSYIIYDNNGQDTILEFTPEDTPINNFGTSGGSTTSLTINSQSVVKTKIKEVHFTEDYSDVTSIGNNFLYSCSSLTSVDLSGLSNVTSIGNGFLANCSSLTSVDLSPLNNVTSIVDGFLANCSSLTSVDLSGLTNLTSIGRVFLGGCSSLTSVDLSPLSNATSIGDGFLNSCSSLTSVDLSGLSNVTSIEYGFLSGCSNLTSVDLSGLSNVTSIGSSFLRQMGTLSEVKMGAITPPTLGYGAFNSTTVQSILVPCESEDAYKTATNWIDKADIIEGDC